MSGGGEGGGHGHNPAMDVVHGVHGGHSMLEFLHGGLEVAGHGIHALHAGAGATAMGASGLGLGMLGLPLGGISVAEGINNFQHGNHSQGVWDVVSGGLGMASGVASIAAGGAALGGGGTAGMAALCAAAPPLAIAAGLAGLGSYGNAYAQDHGWYGHNDDGTNSTFLGGIGNTASQGYDLGSQAGTGLLGDNWAGRGLGVGLGAVTGGLGGVGQTLLNSGAAIGGGVARGWDAVTDW